MIENIASTPTARPAATQQDSLKKAAQQFEAIFLRQMISSMRSASLGDDLFGSSASEQFRDMTDARTADSMAEKGGFGVADLLIKQFQARVGQADPAREDEPAK